MGFKRTAPGNKSHQGPDAPWAHRSLDIPCQVASLPERACVVKGGLCGLYRLRVLLFWLCLQRNSTVRNGGLFCQWFVLSCLRGCSLVEDAIRLVTVLRIHLRGLFGRSFQHATVPLPVPSWTPADRKLRPRSGAIRPTLTISIRSSCGTPNRSIISRTLGRNSQVKGTPGSAGNAPSCCPAW